MTRLCTDPGYEYDEDGVLQWLPPAGEAKITGTAGFNIPSSNAAQRIRWQSAMVEGSLVWMPDPDYAFRVVDAGVYAVSLNVWWTEDLAANSLPRSAGRRSIRIARWSLTNPTIVWASNNENDAQQIDAQTCLYMDYLPAGTVVAAEAIQTSGHYVTIRGPDTIDRHKLTFTDWNWARDGASFAMIYVGGG